MNYKKDTIASRITHLYNIHSNQNLFPTRSISRKLKEKSGAYYPPGSQCPSWRTRTQILLQSFWTYLLNSPISKSHDPRVVMKNWLMNWLMKELNRDWMNCASWICIRSITRSIHLRKTRMKFRSLGWSDLSYSHRRKERKRNRSIQLNKVSMSWILLCRMKG